MGKIKKTKYYEELGMEMLFCFACCFNLVQTEASRAYGMGFKS
jgi:hypothetical protein